MTRRELLAAAMAVPAAAAEPYRYRGYLEWTTDPATNPDPNTDWPSMRLDAALIKDYREPSG